MTEINLDDLPEERMTEYLFNYLMEAACTGREMPLGDTGYIATTGGRAIPGTCLVIVSEGVMFFFAGSIVNRGGMRIKRYLLVGK